MKHAVVTGATSFVGRHLVPALLAKGWQVTAVVRPFSHKIHLLRPHSHLHILELGISQAALLPGRLPGAADVLYHLAWDGVRQPQRNNPELQQKNCRYALEFLQAAHDAGCTAFIGAGSQAEYGIGGRINEETPCRPVSEYGKAKLQTAEQGDKLAAKLDIRFIWPRIFSLYGPGDDTSTLVMSCLAKMRADADIPLSAATQPWDFLHIDDAAAALALLGARSYEGVFNLASGRARPLRDYLQDIKDITGSQSRLLFGEISGSDTSMGFAPSVKKLQAATGWSPKISFEKGIRQLWEDEPFYEKNQYFSADV